MYRQYEDARELENRLQEIKNEFEMRKALGQLEPYDYEDYYMYMADLRERINFAWQDEEYEEDLAREAAFYEVYEN